YVGSCVWILLASTAGTIVLVLLSGSFFGPTLGLSVPWLVLAVLCSGAQFLSTVRLTIWQVEFQALRDAAFQLSTTITNALLSVLLVVVFTYDWQGRVVAQAVATLAGALVAWLTLRRAGFITAAPDRACVKDALRFGLPLVPHSLGGLLLGMS